MNDFKKTEHGDACMIPRHYFLLVIFSMNMSMRKEHDKNVSLSKSTFYEREAKSRVVEKKPPKAAINLGTDVDAPWGEKIETSRKGNHQIA
jgi:hypothetical protein